MPVIPMMGISKGKPCAILVTVSEKRYKDYMANRVEVETPIPAKVFKQFLTESKLPFEEVAQSVLAIPETPKMIYVWEHAEFLDAGDIKEALNKIGGDYDKFVDHYAQHLKSL